MAGLLKGSPPLQTSPPDARVRMLVQSAQQLSVESRHDDAAHIWEQILLLDPNNSVALFRLGQFRHFRKDIPGALDLLEKAALADPRNALIPLSLAVIFRSTGNAESEERAIERALAIDPQCYPALLLRGERFEKLGKQRQAARTYIRALAYVNPEMDLSADLKARVAHAREVVEWNGRELRSYLDGVLAPLRQRHDGTTPKRFDHCLDVATGKKVYVQQPVAFHYPELPAIQFFEDELFPWMAALESRTDALRAEFLKVYREDTGMFAPYVDYPAGTPLNQFAELNRSPKWSALHLIRDGVRFPEACKRCPETVAAMEAVPKFDVEGFGPTVLFSTLAPGTRLPPHNSSTNIRSVVHLPLIVPPHCGFRVGNETREWQEGKAWVFDDTIEHEAWNDSDKLRVILMIDVWNPLIQEAERELVGTVIQRMRDYYN
jgi:aspartate beta-hydroxylase